MQFGSVHDVAKLLLLLSPPDAALLAAARAAVFPRLTLADAAGLCGNAGANCVWASFITVLVRVGGGDGMDAASALLHLGVLPAPPG